MREKIVDFICKWMIVFLGTFVGIGSFAQMFHVRVNLPVLILCEVFFAGLYLGCTLIKNKLLLFTISSISLLGILVFIALNWKQLMNAIYFVANKVIDRNNEHFDRNASHYVVMDNFKKAYVTVLFVLIIVLYAYIIALVTYNRIYAAFHILMLAIFIIPGTLFGTVPNIFYMMCTVIYVLVCVMYQHSKVVYPGRILFLVMLCLAFLGMLLLISPVRAYKINSRYAGLANKVRDYMENIEFFKTVSGENPDEVEATGGVNGGKLGDVSNVHYTDTPMLHVTLTKSNYPVYLKGYTATDYRGNRWERISLDNIQKIRDVGLYYDNEALIYTPPFTNFQDESESLLKEITVQYQNASKHFVYVPYYSDVLRNVAIRFDYGISTKDATRDRYEFSFYNLSEEEAIGRYEKRLSTAGNGDYTERMNFLMMDINLDLPSDVVREFQSKTDIKEGMYENTEESLKECIGIVRNYLDKNTKYSLTPGKLEDGDDFVLDFLFHKKEGYCTAYASAATLLLRYMGVPARYAEGYIVYPSGKANQEGNVEMDVRDNDAHAWTEVYVPGTGFVPIETTPGYRAKDNAKLSQEKETESGSKTGDKETTTSERDSEKTTKTQQESVTVAGGEQTTTPDLSTTGEVGSGQSHQDNHQDDRKNMILILVVVIVLVGSIVSYRVISKRNIRGSYTTSDNRHNVKVIGTLMEKNLSSIGISYHLNDNTTDVSAQIIERIVEASKEREILVDLRETKEVLDIIDKSRYAQRETDITDEEYKKVIKYYEDFKNSLQYLKNRV